MNDKKTEAPTDGASSGLALATGSDSSPESSRWSEHQTKYLPGDLVQTEFGPAIVTKAEYCQRDTYSVWPLPGWKWRREPWGWSPAKSAWYENEELTLIEAGAASKLRPNIEAREPGTK